MVAMWETGRSRPNPEVSPRLIEALAGRGVPALHVEAVAAALQGSPSTAQPRPSGRLDYGGQLDGPRRVATRLLALLLPDPATWQRFLLLHGAFAVLGEASNRRMVSAFLRTSPQAGALREWVADLSPADLRLLVHSCVFALDPVAYAGAGTLQLSLPTLVGWGRVDDLFLKLPPDAIPPGVLAPPDDDDDAPARPG